MKGRVAVLDALADGRKAAALLVDGVLEDLLIDPPEALGPALPGAIFRARVGRPIKGIGGAMADMGGGLTGFLREARGLAPGATVLVQVSGAAEPPKAPPVTRAILFKSRYAIATPGRPGRNLSRKIRDEAERERLQVIAHGAAADDPDMGLILRSAASGAPDREIAEDITRMQGLAAEITAEAGAGEPELLLDAPDAHLAAWRDWADPPPDAVDEAPGSFERHGVWEAVAAALGPAVPLAAGASMLVEPTRALVAVDVNTGPDTSPAAGLKANVNALRALPRSLRLRGLAGQIVIDLAPFPKRERPQLEAALRRALRSDTSETSIAGWTPLGHLELQRKRDRFPLKELLADAMPDLPQTV